MGCISSKNLKDLPTEAFEHKPHKPTISNLIGITNGKFTDHYVVTRALGNGSFGQVREVKELESGILRAVKSINISNISVKQLSMIIEEVNMLKNLDHPGIIKIFKVYKDQNFIHIITELCTGGELFDSIVQQKFLSENQAGRYTFDIVSTMKYCHNNNIVHRDLKPENILFEDKTENSRLKIIDFGTSTQLLSGQNLKSVIGTPYYIAPEVLKGEYNKQCDVWSIGVILYIMLCGKAPFNGLNNEEIYEKILKNKPTFTGGVWKKVSAAAKDLIRKALQKNPAERITIDEMFYDPWIRTRAKGLVPEKLIASKMLKNLMGFTNVNKLRTCTFGFLSHCLASAQDLKNVRDLFESIDTNGDGKLSKNEIAEGIVENCGKLTCNLDQIFEHCDIDQNGYIDYSEFLMEVMSNDIEVSKINLRKAFNALDKDGNGKISKIELYEALETISDRSSINKILMEIDINGDGEIDIEEFTLCISSYIAL